MCVEAQHGQVIGAGMQTQIARGVPDSRTTASAKLPEKPACVVEYLFLKRGRLVC
jgi:hypothetical protein